jgi:hypothetical protein
MIVFVSFALLKYPKKLTYKEKRLVWIKGLELSIHDQVAPLLWASGEDFP